MIYILPTKRGVGVEIWGTYSDLTNLYDVIGKFWSDERYIGQIGFENREKVIGSFSYEIRKAKEGSRLTRKSSHFSFDEQKLFGCQISWVHVLFSLAAVKYNMRYYETSKFDIAQILNIEYWLENAMKSHDEKVATKLVGFIEDGIYGANKYIYQYMRSINLDFHLLGGGKQAFRMLPNLLKRGVFFTVEYKDYESFLQKEAKRLGCEIDELELSDDKVDYENMEW